MARNVFEIISISLWCTFFLSCSYYHIVLLSLLKKPFVVYDGSSLVIFQEMPISFSFLLSLKSLLPINRNYSGNHRNHYPEKSKTSLRTSLETEYRY